ncbi:MAG: hypothetical protein LWX54_16360, partial [Deltaproteobacteria bacterium]|nr:hypothetical protein [Deltaproteobacteria bacterium]
MGTYQRRKGTKPISSPHDLTEDFEDSRKPEKMARLYEESVSFPNLADSQFVVGQAKAAVLGGLKDVVTVQEYLRNKWLIMYRLYRGETIAAAPYARTQLHSPEPYKIVETLHPRIMRALFGNERWFKLYGMHAEHDKPAEAQEMMCRDQLRACSHASMAARQIRDGLIYGTAIQKLYWKQEVGEMRYRETKRIPNPDIPGATVLESSEVKRQEITFDGNHVDNVNIFDFFAPPNASSVDDAEWCADRSSWPDWKVKEMGELGHWVNLEPLRSYAGSNDVTFGDEYKERKRYAYGSFDPRGAANSAHIPHYEVIDWWGPLVIQQSNGGYVTRECNVTIIEPNGPAIVARVTENPFWHRQKPYQAWRPISLEDEFYGIGSLEMITRLSMEKDMKRNLLMAATQLEANPMWLLSDNANVPDGQLLLQPGLTVRVPDVNN